MHFNNTHRKSYYRQIQPILYENGKIMTISDLFSQFLLAINSTKTFIISVMFSSKVNCFSAKAHIHIASYIFHLFVPLIRISSSVHRSFDRQLFHQLHLFSN